MQARFALLKIFISCGLSEVQINADSLLLTVHRYRILSHGSSAVAAFLTKLQVFKATANCDEGILLFDIFTLNVFRSDLILLSGTEFYLQATAVDDTWLPIREIVLLHKQPRKIFVQCNTMMNKDNGAITIKEYPPTLEGVIRSHVERNI